MWRQSVKISRPASFPGPKYFSLRKPSNRFISEKNGSHRNLSTSATEGRGSMGVFVVTTGIAAIIGGTFYYAKKNTDFRKTVEKKLPFTSPLFDFALGETKTDKNQSTLLPPSLPTSSHMKESVSDRDHTESDMSGKKLKSSLDEASVTVSSVDQIAVSSVDLDIAKTVEKEVLEEDKNDVKDSDQATALEMEAKEVSLQIAMAAVIDMGEHVLQSQEEAIDVVLAYKDSIREVINNQDELSNEHIETLEQSKVKALNEAEAMVEKFNELVEKVHVILTETKEMETNFASETLAQLTHSVQQKRDCLIKVQKEEVIVIKQYEDYLNQEKQHLKQNTNDQIENVKSEEELLVLAQNEIKLLENSLEERNKEQKVTEALQKQKEELEKLSEMKLKEELGSLKTELTNLMKEKEAALMEEHEKELRQQLRRQAAVFGDHLNDVLKLQKNELVDKHQSEKRQEMILQRQEFDLKIRGALSRLQGVLKAVENRAFVEKANFQAQELWLACQSLFQAISDSGSQDNHYTSTQLSTIKEEVDRIRHVTNDDKVISAVLDSLPQDVLQRGLYTENLLHRRFANVKKVCQQVALVGDDDAGLWSYVISYFQSLLMFEIKHVKHPTSVDPHMLDTHTILSLTAKSLDEGDTEQAVRYMNQLRGEARRVAKHWMEETRLFLETKQVTEFLIALASAYNIGTK